MKRHDERPFSCSHCDKKFTNRDPLKECLDSYQNEANLGLNKNYPAAVTKTIQKFTNRYPYKTQVMGYR